MPTTAPLRQQGYILIYVAGILLFLSAVVMGMAVALRLDSQVLLRQKENLQSEYRLEAGLQYALAQLAKAGAVETAANLDVREKAGIDSWKADGSRHQAEIGGATVYFVLEDAGGALDINTLSEDEWKRYFTALGLGSPEDAAVWAKRMIEARDLAKQNNGGNGFANIEEVLALETVPATARYGRGSSESGAAAEVSGGSFGNLNAGAGSVAVAPAVAGSGAAAASAGASSAGAVYAGPVPSMRDLFSVGTNMRQIEVNRSALPLFAALTTATLEQLIAFDRARAAKPLTVDEAVKVLGDAARQVVYVGKSPLLRLRLETEAGPGRLGMAVLLKSENGQFTPSEKRLSNVQPGQSLLDLLLPANDSLDLPSSKPSAPSGRK